MKYLLRTDVIFRRERPIGDGLRAFEEWCEAREWSDELRGWKALWFAEGLEDAEGGMEAVVWYKRAERFGVRIG